MKTELMIAWRYLGKTRRERIFALFVFPAIFIVTGILPLFIYMLFKRKGKFPLSGLPILGTAIGVMALIVVLAVMTGFDKDLREKIVGNYSHITLSGYKAIDTVEYDGILKKISAIPHVQGVSPYIQGQVLVKEGNKYFAVGIKGIDPATESKVTKIGKYIVAGNIDNLSQDGIVIGRELAFYLGLHLNSPVIVYSPLGKQFTFKVAGIFTSGMYDYDMNLVFTNIKAAQEILGLSNQITSVAIKLDNLYLADKVRDVIIRDLGLNYVLKTWMEANANFFAALKLEKITMFIILTLIVFVASFNIVSMLIVMVTDKTKDIGILRAIGMSSSSIRRIFTLEGLIIGGVGTFLGALGGFWLCALLKKYQFIKLPQDIYYIDRLPVSIALWPDIAVIVLAALAITLISTIYPAAKAAQLKPVEALRYE